MSVIYINSYQFAAPAGPTDPYFSNVSLLLHGDGANGSTTIVDSSPSPKTVTAVGNAQISTAQSKFGGSSLAFDGSGDYLTVQVALPLSLALEILQLKDGGGELPAPLAAFLTLDRIMAELVYISSLT
jgi:hypothetical protein